MKFRHISTWPLDVFYTPIAKSKKTGNIKLREVETGEEIISKSTDLIDYRLYVNTEIVVTYKDKFYVLKNPVADSTYVYIQPVGVRSRRLRKKVDVRELAYESLFIEMVQNYE